MPWCLITALVYTSEPAGSTQGEGGGVSDFSFFRPEIYLKRPVSIGIMSHLFVILILNSCSQRCPEKAKKRAEALVFNVHIDS